MSKINTFCLVLLGLALNSYTASSQSKLGNILSQLSKAGSSPSTAEIGTGLKQALETGISHGSDQLSAKDGFLGNLAVKILFPPEAQQAEKTLRSIGMGRLADNVVTSMNRAAEDAAKAAKPIFLAAIRQMSITDAKSILLGTSTAATSYFKEKTTAQLLGQFSPVIQASLAKTGASRYWAEAAGSYNKLVLVKPVQTDLAAYVTQKAVDGMFVQVAQEEINIRSNLDARSTVLLQKVFGYADKNKLNP